MTYTIRTFDSAPRVPFDLDGRILLTTERCELVHLALQPGECLPLHAQPFAVIFHLLAGNGILLVGNDEIPVNSATSIEVSSGTMRGWINPGPDELRLLVIKMLR